MSEISEPAAGGSALTTLPSPPDALDTPSSEVPALDVKHQEVQSRRARLRQRLRRLGWIASRPPALLRYFLRKLLWVLIRVLRAGWRHPIVSLILIIAAGLGYQGYNEYIKEEPPPPPREVYDIAPAIPPPDAAEAFLQAQREFDGAAIWDMLPEETKTNLLGQGVTKQVYAQRFLNLRANGVFFGDSVYVGGVKGTSGIDHYFYVTTLPLGNGQVTEIYQVLFIDSETGAFLGWENPIPDDLMSST